jgi:hypothetical protein
MEYPGATEDRLFNEHRTPLEYSIYANDNGRDDVYNTVGLSCERIIECDEQQLVPEAA